MPAIPKHDPGSDDFVERILSRIAGGTDDDLGDLLIHREEELGISESQAARILGLSSANHLRRLKDGQRTIDAITLIKLSNYLGLGADSLIKVLAARFPVEAIGDIERSRKNHFIAKHFDLKGLQRAGFIKSTTDFGAIEARIASFFGLDSLFHYDTEVAFPLFSRRRAAFKDKMREFWVRTAYFQFEQHPNPHEYDRDRLLAVVPQIKQYSRFEKKGLVTVARALFRAGVTVIVQPYLTGTSLYGASFVVDGKPCVVLTDQNKQYARIWFALLHELSHVLKDWDDLVSLHYHLSGDYDDMLVEVNADYFASELLLPSKKIDYITTHIDNPHLVRRYAEQNDIHESIVYWLCANRRYRATGNQDFFRLYNRQIQLRPDDAIRALKCYPWESETPDAVMERVMQTLAEE
jgi:Zn-dependent peptidase ImmA (M78 family)/transcriptional regulator with XRE-family HTH domain